MDLKPHLQSFLGFCGFTLTYSKFGITCRPPLSISNIYFHLHLCLFELEVFLASHHCCIFFFLEFRVRV